MKKKQRFRDSKLVRWGTAMVVLGSAPLLFIVLLAKLGMTHDPNPNPVGAGMLTCFTFYPGLTLILIGLLWTWASNGKDG